MSLMTPPQTRYRVKESGGRLVVIDTYSGDSPATARDIIGGDQIIYARASEAVSGMDLGQASGGSLMGTAKSETPPAMQKVQPQMSTRPRPAPPRPSMTEPVNPWGTPEVSVTSNRSAEPFGTVSGTPTILHTKNWYDKKAPRTIAVSAKRMQQLAILLAVMVIGAIIMIAQFGFGVTFVAGFFLIRFGISSFVTPWLDAAERGG